DHRPPRAHAQSNRPGPRTCASAPTPRYHSLASSKQARIMSLASSKRDSTELHMATDPSREYTRSWCPSGEIDYLELADGTRLRYLRTGSGRSALVLLHTVRTQLDHFQLVIPLLRDAFTVYAIDLPGMGWSDITAGARYTEPALRHAVIELVTSLNLTDVTLAGESMGATLSLTVAIELRDRVRRVHAFNVYDYSKGVGRANRVAAAYVAGARLPVLGAAVTSMENKPVLRIVLRGGLCDPAKLPDHYLSELRRVARRRGYARVARAVFGHVESLMADRALYPHVAVPVALVYGDHDWSHSTEREANLDLLPSARSIALRDTGHFAAIEQPARVAQILLDSIDERS